MACQSPSTMATNSHDSWLLMWISDLDRGKNLPEIPNSIGKKKLWFPVSILENPANCCESSPKRSGC
jgi:hypothetical protein